MALPDFIVERDDEFAAWSVICPRKNCGRWFLVDDKWTLMVRVEREDGEVTFIHGRMCPYCSAASAIPEGIRRKTIALPAKRKVRYRKRKTS